MNPDDFELEAKLRSLSINQETGSTNNEREHELAELIANCVADVEPRDVQSEDEQKSGETKENELPTSLIVTNLPQELFFQQELKVLSCSTKLYLMSITFCFPVRRNWRPCSGHLTIQPPSTTCVLSVEPESTLQTIALHQKPGSIYITHLLGIV